MRRARSWRWRVGQAFRGLQQRFGPALPENGGECVIFDLYPMGRVFQARANAVVCTPTAGKTFAELVSEHSASQSANPAITNDEVALFNWGTTDTQEVLRALREVVGVKEEHDNPYDCKLDPTLGADGKFLLPNIWKPSGLALEKTYKVTLNKRLPAPAVSFNALSKWFIPGDQKCEIRFHTEGIAERADKMDFEVRAGNYCKATPTNNNEFVDYAFAALDGVPIFQKTLPTDSGKPRTNGEVTDWDGESKAASGILTPRGTDKRLINVACSPYTVNLRYYKTTPSDLTNAPRIEIDSFWLTWSGATPTLDADSKKIKYSIKACTVLKYGQVIVTKKDGAVVWRRALKHSEVTEGDHTIDDWTADGVSAANMPYRVEIQAHTDWETDDGMALAAMHTEVRLYVHPETGTKPDPFTEAASLTFGLAPFLPGPAPADDSAKGRKLKLASAGYHPGPVNDDETDAGYLMAVKELQRDFVESGSTTRLKADGTINDATKTVITALPANRRPLFGVVADRSDLATGSINDELKDPSKTLVVWASDRHVYTKVDAPKPVANINANAELENYRDGMALAADGKVDKDAASICRPRIPVQSALCLLGKDDDLDTTKGSIAPTDNMRKAIGPIRVDWTFREPPPQPNVDTGAYYDRHMRSQAYLNSVFTSLKGAHNGKDANNCKVAYGGIRSANYHQDPFASGIPDSLTPWAAQVDGGQKSVCSVVHDDLGQDAARLFDTHVGKAGVYLKLSTIGGDGFTFRGQVRFDNLPSGTSPPNWATLKKRYPKLPHVISCTMRVWRKSSLKGYMAWCSGPERHWGGGYNVETKFAAYYKPAYVHFVHEAGAAGVFDRATVFPNTDLVQFQNVVGDNTQNVGINYSAKAAITLKDNYLWPWCDEPHVGVKATLGGNLGVNAWWSTYSDTIYNETWRKWRYPLMYEILKRIETANPTRLRGHFVVEFKDSPQLWIEGYVCPNNNAHKHWMLETTNTGGSSIAGNESCQFCPNPKPKLISSRRQRYRCSGGPQGTHEITVNENPAGNSKTGAVCGVACTGVLNRDLSSAVAGFFKKITSSSVNTTYECTVCHHKTTVSEPASSAGARNGQACAQTCAGTMSPVGGTLTNQQIYGPISGIGLPAVGAALGGSWIFTETKPEPTWAHEIGHHKHLEHAASGPGAKADQHDSSANANVTNPPEATALKRNWDRCCIMSYTSDDGANDRLYFCGRCILKLRGWKVEPGALVVAGGTNGP